MPTTLHQLKERKRKAKGLATRETKQAMYNTAAWRKYAREFKRENPLCEECMKDGKVAPTYALDHIIPHNGNKRLFWSPRNHQGLCITHHNIKSRSER